MTTILYIAASIIIVILGIIAGYYHAAYKTEKKENDAIIKSISEFIHTQDDYTKFTWLIAKNSTSDVYLKQYIEDYIREYMPDLMGTQSQTTISNESTEG